MRTLFIFDHDGFFLSKDGDDDGGSGDDDMSLLMQRVFLHRNCVQSSRHCARVKEKNTAKARALILEQNSIVGGCRSNQI